MFRKKVFPLIIAFSVLMLAACGCASLPAGETGPAPVNVSTADVPTAPSSSEGETEESTAASPAAPQATDLSYPIVDTGQYTCSDASSQITCPAEGEAFYGQDAQYAGNQPSYTDNGDPSTGSGQAGTVTDNVTGLMWQQSPDTDGNRDINAEDKLTYAEAGAYCDNLSLAGYNDWWLPNIKQLYSLIDFRGTDPIPEARDTADLTPFIDTDTFDFAYGDMDAGERVIDAQFASSTLYVATTMGGAQTMFGVNFADGRIKGYGLTMPGGGREKTFFVLCARGNAAYGVNSFSDNGDHTISDYATGLMWAQDDSGIHSTGSGQGALNWEEALAWVAQKNAEAYLGYSDWRLPNAKELQSIVDYTRAPDTTNSAAIAPLFNVTRITNEAGQADYPSYWSSTTHLRFDGSATDAVYIAFGRGLGSMDGETVIDVHGAGSQRGDPKDGDPAAYPSWGHGPQGDVRRVYNYVRLVRDGGVTLDADGDPDATHSWLVVEPAGEQQGQPPAGGQLLADGPQQPPSDGQQPPTGAQPPVGEQQTADGQQPPTGEQQPPTGGQPGNDGQAQQPPPEAIEACASLTEGAACSFQAPHGQVLGICALIQQQIACVPEGRPGGGPPQAP